MVRSGRFLAPSSALTMDSRISYVRSHPSNELISPVLLHALMCTRPCVATGLRVLLLTSMPGLFASPVPPSDPSSIPWKILMDQTVYAASKYSMYLGLVNLLRGRDCTDCVQEIREKLWPTLTTGWRFWPAVHIITYNLIPPRHRVLWVNCADLIWVTLLASIARSVPVFGTHLAAMSTHPNLKWHGPCYLCHGQHLECPCYLCQHIVGGRRSVQTPPLYPHSTSSSA